MRICAGCKKPFTVLGRSRGTPRKYHGPKCRAMVHQKRSQKRQSPEGNRAAVRRFWARTKKNYHSPEGNRAAVRRFWARTKKDYHRRAPPLPPKACANCLRLGRRPPNEFVPQKKTERNCPDCRKLPEKFRRRTRR